MSAIAQGGTIIGLRKYGQTVGLMCYLALLSPSKSSHASDGTTQRDTSEVLRLLAKARQPTNDLILGVAYDSTLCAQALALAERIGWERGVFKGHLWSLQSIAKGDYVLGPDEWDRHFLGATQRRSLANGEELVLLHLTTARRYAMRHIPDTAALYTDTLRTAAERHGDERLRAVVMYTRAQVLRRAERWGEAFRMALAANEMAEQLDDDLLRAFTYNLSGFIRGRLGHLEDAVKDLRASLMLADSMGITTLRLRNHSNWGYMMQVKGRWRDALDHYHSLRSIAIATGWSREEMGEIDTGIGYMLLRMDSLDQSEEVLGRLRSTKAMVGHGYEQEFNTAWALLQLRRGHYREAIASALTAFTTEQWDENDVIKRDASRVLADAYKALGRSTEALKWTEVTHQWEDSVRYRQQANEALRLEMESEFAKRAIRDSLERAEAELLLAQERSTTRRMDIEHRMQRISLIVVTGFIILFAGVLFVRARTGRRMQLEQLRTRLSRDLHDDIGSTLSSINILSTVAKRKAEAGDEAGAAASLAGIGERTQRLMRNMSDIVWSVDPDKDTFAELMARMREFGAAVLEPKGIIFRFDSQGEINATMPPMVKSNLYLIFKEAVNNAAKHAQAGEVTVSFTRDNDRLRMTISDNGTGMDAHEGALPAVGGNGLRNMRMRALEMKADLRMNSMAGHGTTLDLVVPL